MTKKNRVATQAVRIGLAVAVALVGATTAGAQTVIDFEGHEELTPISDEYVGEGVVFYLVGTGDLPYIATEGEPGVAWVTWYPETMKDVAVSGVNTLASGGMDYGASFAPTVSDASLALSDFGDCVDATTGTPVTAHLDAFDADGALVDTDSFTIPRFVGGPDDGNVAILSVAGTGIARVETRGAGADCGTSIDDFSFSLEGCVDFDGDGVCNADDICPDTAPIDSVPSVRLGSKRWADTNGDGVLDSSDGLAGYSFADTGGCSCAQILEAMGIGNGHDKFGCTGSTVNRWIKSLQN